MAIPQSLKKGLRLPVIAAPMFLVSGPNLVKAACRAGVIGTFPTLNARPMEVLEAWMSDFAAMYRDEDTAPWGVNLIVHPTNTRLQEDLDLVLKYKPPLVITSVGHPGDIAEKVHGYGGVVFHDVIHMYHAQKAADAGVDGIIAVCAGAGGHAGEMNPFTFIPQLRDAFDKTIILAGTISDGRSIRAAEMLGADMAYMGTRFIATEESEADAAYREMIVQDSSRDIVYTDKVSGIRGNFLKSSVDAAGLDPVTGEYRTPNPDFDEKNKRGGGTKGAWKQIWSAGQGIGQISDSPTVATLVDRLEEGYKSA